MNTRDDACAGGAVDQKAFEDVMKANLSPEGLTAVVATLRVASVHRPRNEKARAALREVEWLADTLRDLVGVRTYNRLIDELGL